VATETVAVREVLSLNGDALGPQAAQAAPPALPAFLNKQEVAELLRVSPPVILKAIREKHLIAACLGGQWRIRRDHVESWLSWLQGRGPDPANDAPAGTLRLVRPRPEQPRLRSRDGRGRLARKDATLPLPMEV
jgi:excisionase family DNA binding protein